MVEKPCDLWLENAEYRCILTNGALTGEGEAILDTPSALQAATRYHGLASDLGRLIASRGNHVHLIRAGVVSFPARQYQWAKPSPQIIERSARALPKPCCLGPDAGMESSPGKRSARFWHRFQTTSS